MTDMCNLHTCTVRGVNIVAAVVLVAGGEALQFAGDVVGGTTVHIPVRIYAVRTGRGRGDALLRWPAVVVVEALAAAVRRVPFLATDLAEDPGLEVAALAVPAAAIVVATALVATLVISAANTAADLAWPT